MRTPKLFEFALSYQTVKSIFFGSKFKRKSTHHKGKQHHSQSENVTAFRVIAKRWIFATQMNFWCHIPSPSSLVRSQHLVSLLKKSTKSKVGQFDSDSLLVIGDEDVLRFYVPMNNRITMNVADCLHNLPKDKPSVLDFQGSTAKKLQQISMFSELLSQQIIITIFFRKYDIFSKAVNFNHIIVRQFAENFPLILKMFAFLEVLLGNSLKNDLYLWLLPKNYFGIASSAYNSQLLTTQLHQNYNRKSSSNHNLLPSHNQYTKSVQIPIRIKYSIYPNVNFTIIHYFDNPRMSFNLYQRVLSVNGTLKHLKQIKVQVLRTLNSIQYSREQLFFRSHISSKDLFQWKCSLWTNSNITNRIFQLPLLLSFAGTKSTDSPQVSCPVQSLGTARSAGYSHSS